MCRADPDQSTSQPSSRSETLPAYADAGIGTSIFSADNGSTQIFTSNRSIIYTGHSPTIYAGPNATLITTSTPKTVTDERQVILHTNHHTTPPSSPLVPNTSG